MTQLTRIAEAFAFVERLHESQTRKGSGAPYLFHLMSVAALVGENGGSEAQVIAALLHDAVEDQGGLTMLEEIRSRFGEEVASYVAACSDTFEQPKPPWRSRKEAFLEKIAVASPEAKLVCAADKLHNTRSLIAALRTSGDSIWDRFRGGREGTLWYHAEMVRALSEGWNHPILGELADAVDRLFRMAAR